MTKIKEAVSNGPLHIAILVICALWILPSLGLLVSSFRPARAVRSTGWWTAIKPPYQFTLDSYVDVLTGQTDYRQRCAKQQEESGTKCSFIEDVISPGGLGRNFLNSLIIAIPATILPILLAAFAAYAFAWMEFPGRDLLFLIVVGLLVVPLQMTLIPVLKLYTRFHLTGTFAGIWLAHTAYGLPYAVYLLYNFFKALPRDLFESAFLDGASEFTVFYRLLIPLSVPSLASLGIFQFMWVWNDLLVALTYLGGKPSVTPITVPISNLVSSMGAGWHLLTAAAFISMILPLAVFFGLQRYFVRGILAGSVKG